MGFSVTFASVPLDGQDAFLDAAGVHVTDQSDTTGRCLISAAEHEEHFLIWRNLRQASVFSEPDWQQLSKAAPITVLDVVDTAGAQKLAFYEEGEEVWVIEGSDEHVNFLGITGAPPHDVDEMRQRIHEEIFARSPEMREEPAENLVAHDTEIPGRIFEDLTGLYYEDGPPDGLIELSSDLPLVKLTLTGQRKEATAKPWWKIW